MFSYFCRRPRLLNIRDLYISWQNRNFQPTWKSEICEFDAPIHTQENIIRLDVSVWSNESQEVEGGKINLPVYDLILVQVSDPQ